MRNVSDKSCIVNQDIFYDQELFSPPKNPAVYEIMWKNIVDPDRPLMIILRMHIVC
jgi:hypothetical protein